MLFPVHRGCGDQPDDLVDLFGPAREIARIRGKVKQRPAMTGVVGDEAARRRCPVRGRPCRRPGEDLASRGYLGWRVVSSPAEVNRTGVEQAGQQILVVPVRPRAGLPVHPRPRDQPTRLDPLAAAHPVEFVDRLRHGPSPGEPVRLQQRVPALPGDVRGHPVQHLDRQVGAVSELAQILIPDPPGTIVVTHGQQPLPFMTTRC